MTWSIGFAKPIKLKMAHILNLKISIRLDDEMNLHLRKDKEQTVT